MAPSNAIDPSGLQVQPGQAVSVLNGVTSSGFHLINEGEARKLAYLWASTHHIGQEGIAGTLDIPPGFIKGVIFGHPARKFNVFAKFNNQGVLEFTAPTWGTRVIPNGEHWWQKKPEWYRTYKIIVPVLVH